MREGVPDEQGTLVDVPASGTGAEVLALREWAEEQAEAAAAGGAAARTATGERDNAPRHSDRGWRQVSVSHRECLGAARCPFGEECFAERAKERAGEAHLVVTNHSLLAIDAIEGVPMIPDYDAVVVDEAHELVARVTQATTDELSGAEVERAARRVTRFVDDDVANRFADAAEALREVLEDTTPGRLDRLPDAVSECLAMVRDAARGVVSAMGSAVPAPAVAPAAPAVVGRAPVAQTWTPAGPRRAAGPRRCS